MMLRNFYPWCDTLGVDNFPTYEYNKGKRKGDLAKMYENLVGLKGGSDATFWEVVAVSKPHSTKYWPAMDEQGNEKSYFDFSTLEAYAAAKVERRRVTVSLTIAGNPIAAEDEIKQRTGKNCMAVGPNTLQIYVTDDSPEES